MIRLLCALSVSLALFTTSLCAQVTQLPEFTFQGRLENGGSPANGSYDLEFSLYDQASGGSQIGSSLLENAFPVVDGLFTVSLAFPGAFTGDQRWLEVRVNGQPLTPRQAVGATPVAQFALDGNPGPQGAQGPTGADGTPGVQGTPGEIGPQGPQGDTGVAGAIGPQGETGAPGAIGPQGIPGEPGPQGPQGDTGVAGAIGPPGVTGEIGPQGPQGAIGQQGDMGPVGPVGEPGVAGDVGAQGLQGETGPQGPAGPAGEDGSGFVDAPADGQLYARRDNNWSALGNGGQPSLQAEILADAPLLYYPLDDAAGSGVFTDLGSAGLDATISANSPATFKQGHSLLFPTSDSRYAMMIEGPGKAMAAGNPWGSNPPAAVSVEFVVWVGLTASGQTPVLTITDGSGASAPVVLAINLLNMQPQMKYGIDTRVNPEVLAKGRSYHVIMTCDGVVNEMYINGHRMQTQSMSAANIPADPHVWVGSQPAQQRPYRIDTFGHIALYDHVLSDARIIAHGRAAGLYGQ